MNTYNLGSTQQDYSIYLPAISSFYVKQLQKWINDPSDARTPAGFELGNEGMDFLNPDHSYFHYPWGLYSAGHAELDPDKSDEREGMIQKRDRTKTMILGDSGGFQIATGVLKMDWTNALDPNDPAREAICEKILAWLEHTSDWAMTLDIPAFAASPPLSKKTGLTKFSDCLDISEHNLNYFMLHRHPEKTKFLNVLSGSNELESKEWYNRVKKYSDPKWVATEYGNSNRTLEGYAFAGVNMRHMKSVLNRLLDLREDGLFEGKDWIHFLGTGKLNWACHLTSIQRCLRKWDNPNITLSFDAASPFVNTAYGSTYTQNFHTNKKFGYSMDRAIDNKLLKGSTLPMPWAHSPIMERLTVGDLCIMGPGDVNKQGKTSSTSWDTQSYALYMAHSVYNHITAVQEANRLADVEQFRAPANYAHWEKRKKSSTANETSPHVPATVLMFNQFAQDFFDPNTPNPRQLLDAHAEFLNEISFGEMTENSVTNQFFETQDYAEGDAANDMLEEIMYGDFGND